MGNFKTWRSFLSEFPRRLCRGTGYLLTLLILYMLVVSVIRIIVPPSEAVGLQGMPREAHGLQFLHDDTWLNALGDRYLYQSIFDTVFTVIADSRELLLVDMFLFNDWQGPSPETHRALSAELTQALINQKAQYPDLAVIVISDPLNTVYGGVESTHFSRLRQAGIDVVLTDLTQLQDSNPLWSGLWRHLIRPFGNGHGAALPNPFGEGRVSVRSYLALLNFKANHRKLLLADDGKGGLQAVVSSANPHDGSSAHRNVALRFTGPAVLDLLSSERALLAMSGAADKTLRRVDDFMQTQRPTAPTHTTDTLQILNESTIHDAIMTSVEQAVAGDAIDLLMFYLSERQIVQALKQASQRGVNVRVLLDVNSDAFGRAKNGVPNRPVAAELAQADIDVRWCATQGEQCHAKWLHVRHGDDHTFLLGSANYTRRNLLDLNMETNALIRTTDESSVTRDMLQFFNKQWYNQDDRTYSVSYDSYADDSLWLTLQYRFMEMTGLSTF